MGGTGSKRYVFFDLNILDIKLLRGRVQTTWTNEGGGGVAQMTTTLNNSYLVKVST